MASCKKRADVSMIQISSFFSKTDIRNPLSLLAHERSRFATCVQIISNFTLCYNIIEAVY